jgi:hypothetical protein
VGEGVEKGSRTCIESSLNPNHTLRAGGGRDWGAGAPGEVVLLLYILPASRHDSASARRRADVPWSSCSYGSRAGVESPSSLGSHVRRTVEYILEAYISKRRRES